MAAKYLFISTLMALILIDTMRGNEIGDRRIKQLQRKVTKIERLLKGIEQKDLGCNKTIYSVSEKVDEVSGMLEHVYKGPLYTRMDLTDGYKNYDKVLITLPDAMEKCVNSYRGTSVETDRAEITCLQQIMWRYEEPQKARRMRRFRQTVRKYATQKITDFRPLPRIRIRKEYRTLTDVERQRFHNAMNNMYQDGIIEAFAEVHKAADPGAHGGPAFLPWHRIFILIFETALRIYDSRVTLPYWDSTMDDARENPTNSIMWTSKLVGNGAGKVVTGDFANWSTNKDFLSRAYGEKSRLVSKEDVENMMMQCYYEDISLPFGLGENRLEQFHNNVHRWVGGDMGAVGTAPYDPVFYLHHCYIDYLWEKFRDHQRDDCGIDPQIDYPVVNQANQKLNDDMLQMEYFTVADGMSDFWTKYIYRYEDSPTCDDYCGSSDLLICDPIEYCCIPKGRFQGPTQIQALPLPGSDRNMPRNLERLSASPMRCDLYMDPECQLANSILKEKAGLQLQPGDELRTIELMVAVNRGRQFSSDPGELRNLQTLKEDVEQYERQVMEYKAEQAAKRRMEKEGEELENGREKMVMAREKINV